MRMRRAPFWAAGSVIALGQWGGTAPSVLYPVYGARWHLSPVTTTTIFAVYPTLLVIALLIFGSVSDVLGRRFAMLTGAALIGLGAIVFTFAPSELWLYVGRGISGAGTGISVGAASAALVEFNRSKSPARASAVNTIGSSVGLLGASIVSGALVQYAPGPTRLPYLVMLILSLLVGGWVALGPGQRRTAGVRWRPRPIAVPAGTRAAFAAAALSIFSGLGLGSIILSLGAQISRDLIHTHNVLVQGLLLGISSGVIGLVALLFRSLPPRTSIMLGGASGVLALAALVPSSLDHSLPLYLASQILGGAAMGFALLGGIGLIQREAPAHHRAALISSFYLVGYLGQGLVATLAGLAATAWGLPGAIVVFSIALAAVGIVVMVVARAPSAWRTASSAVARR
ncbi:putative MFS family arabinose efflux permease [Asanoa ferruginea]|uniref:Putative MFS family arabinose efflux permease n=1 Tax=Asanoa ferruginea TaxID=53367 RepID=A0A3E0A5W9_9ACTN|nr:MFS transporter [Asanoa ferruginea]REG01791.1 putative MFS family arabinose efflux permease [Asanoa ferruginea]GIF49175.1 putative multi-drug efflux transporter [Asanoa ferruginea]